VAGVRAPRYNPTASWQVVEIRRISAACYRNMDVPAKLMTVKSLILREKQKSQFLVLVF
jgi:hypothetical protein